MNTIRKEVEKGYSSRFPANYWMTTQVSISIRPMELKPVVLWEAQGSQVVEYCRHLWWSWCTVAVPSREGSMK